ncbi:MAG: hypothetical protein AB7J28_11310 [Hyphomonadaceae bacterium]
MVKRLSIAMALMAAACGQSEQAAAPAAETAAPAAPQLEELWRVEGLAAPESVAISQDGSFLYVTNVNGEGEARDGNGFISRISMDGRILEREWARGFDAPKGIVRRDDALYVADIDRLVVVDAATGAIRRRIALPGAGFANDVALAPDRAILVSDSANARIYRVGENDAVTVWWENPLLQAVNGIAVESGRLIVSTMAGRLLRLNYPSTEGAETIAEGIGDGDGIGVLGGGAYLVTEWPGRMFYVAPGRALETILDTREQGILLNDSLLAGSVLYQPNWAPGTLTAYRVIRP